MKAENIRLERWHIFLMSCAFCALWLTFENQNGNQVDPWRECVRACMSGCAAVGEARGSDLAGSSLLSVGCQLVREMLQIFCKMTTTTKKEHI